jgi:serine/threonine-protein kinase
MSAAPGQEPQVAVYSTRTGEKRKLIDDGVDALYVDSGHLVFARLGHLIAVPFDLESLEIVGPEVPVLEGVSQSTFIGNSFMETSTAQFTVSDSGLLAYARGSVAPELERDLVLVDFLGEETRVEIEKKNFLAARVAKDGNRVLLTTNYPPWAVWLFDIERGTLTRQTFSGLTHWATWGPGPDQFTFESFDSEFGGSGRIYVKEVGSGPAAAEPLSDEGFWAPSSWSPDGEHLAALKLDQNTRWDIWILDAYGKAEALLNSEFNESYPEFSPDGRWLLYVSNESGRNEVYVRPFPGPGSAIHISVGGGSKPCWSREGDQIFFWVYSEELETDKLNAVDIREESGTLTVTRPKELFEGSYHSASPLRSADVTADNRLIVIPRPSQEAKDALTEAMMPDRIQLVQNWATELELKVPRQR